MSKVDVVILAGAPAGEELSPESAGMSRAMIRIGDKTMLQWVVDALKGSGAVGRVVAVGEVCADGLDQVIESGGSMVENIRLGVSSLEDAERVLVVCGDIPMLTPKAVDDFIERAKKLDVDLAFPIIPRSHCETRYPGIKRTYLTTGDGVFTGGNLMLVRPEFIEQNWQAIAGAYAARKQVVKLARMIGLGMLARVMLSRVCPGILRISMIEQTVSRMLNARVGAVVSAYPEIGEDVDKPSDLEAVRSFMRPANL